MMTRQQKGTVRQSFQRNKKRPRPKKTNKRKSVTKKRQLQEWLKTRLVKRPKANRRSVQPVSQSGKGIALGLLGGLIPLIIDLIKKA